MRISLLSVVLLALLSVSCSTVEYRYIPVDLMLPPPLGITVAELEPELTCVSDDTYVKIVQIINRIETLEDIISSASPSSVVP